MVYPSSVHKNDRMHPMHSWILFFFHFQYTFYLRFYFVYILFLLSMFFFGFHIIQENITLTGHIHTQTLIHAIHTHGGKHALICMHTCTTHMYNVCLSVHYIVLCRKMVHVCFHLTAMARPDMHGRPLFSTLKIQL